MKWVCNSARNGYVTLLEMGM